MQSLLAALALVLVLEGLLPLFSPATWRTAMRRFGALADGQIRFVGLMAVGLSLIHI